MAIEDKIKDIQQKPESVRMIYIFVAVTVVMTFVVVLWIFSIRDSVRNVVRGVEDSTPSINDTRGQINTLQHALDASVIMDTDSSVKDEK